MSMNDDPRGFRRGPANRENSQQQRGQPQQPRDRYEQYPQQGDPRASRLPPERPQPSFSAYKPEAYAKGDPQAPNGDWDRKPPQRPAAPRQQRPDMAPPLPPQRHEPPMSDPYSMPGDLPNDPYYQPAVSDPYAARNQGGFVNNWNNDDFGGAPNQFQNFYQDDQPGFDGDPQSVHDEFFSGADHGFDAPPPPVPSNREFPAGGFNHDHDDPYADPDQNFFGSDDDAFGAEPPMQRSRPPQKPPRGPQGFDDQDFYDWDEFEQGPAPAAARPFHPPAVREEDVDADFFADEDDLDIEEYEGSGGKRKLLAAVLAGAIVVGGGGAYLYTSGEGNFSAGDAPSIIAADDSPIKEQPEDPGGRDFPNGNKLIYDRLGGDDSAQQQASASGQGEPAQVAASIPGLVASNGRGTLEERIENALRAQGGQQPEPSPADTPRTVQTLTFGPDGSQQPAQPQTQTVSSDDSASNPLSSSIVVSTQPSSAPSYESVQAAPVTNSVSAQPAVEQQVETRLAAANPQVDAIVSGGGSDAYFVQIGARNDAEAASEAFKTLQQRYASVIGNYSPSLRKADLGAKGVWYRLWVGPVDNKVEAEALCEQLKQAGMQACLVRKDQ